MTRAGENSGSVRLRAHGWLLPPELVTCYAWHDGQQLHADNGPGPLIPHALSLDDAIAMRKELVATATPRE